MNEILFLVENTGWRFIAHALEVSIITEADDSESLYIQIGMQCIVISVEEIPQIIRLFSFVKK